MLQLLNFHRQKFIIFHLFYHVDLTCKVWPVLYNQIHLNSSLACLPYIFHQILLLYSNQNFFLKVNYSIKRCKDESYFLRYKSSSLFFEWWLVIFLWKSTSQKKFVYSSEKYSILSKIIWHLSYQYSEVYILFFCWLTKLKKIG